MLDNMDFSPLITVVTVAFNNPKELDCLFDCLSKQTVRITRVICVDNSNNSFLESNHQIISKWANDLNINYYINNTDIKGSARGFKIGLTEALKTSFDFVWINDQDGTPKNDCLKKMIDAYLEVQQNGIYAPLILANDGHYVLNNFRCNVNAFKRRKQSKFKVCDKIRAISFAATTGIMIHREVVEICGVYNDEAFFVGLEDAEYSYRATKNKFKIFLVQNAQYFHPDLYIKYKKQPSPFLNFLRRYPFFPNYLGCVAKNGATTRELFFCIGNSYINCLYCSLVPRLINSIYSFLRVLCAKLFNKGISIHETLRLYKKGRMMANRSKAILKKSHENKKSS